MTSEPGDLTSQADPRTASVAGVMTPAPVRISLDDDLWTALRIFLTTGLRHLVVVDVDNRCRGVLADRYVAAAWPGDAIGARLTRVRQMMPDSAPLLAPETSISEAARAMLTFGTDAIVVVDKEGRALGVVTGSDLIRSLADGAEVRR